MRAGNSAPWAVAHNRAVSVPRDNERIVDLIRAWQEYATAHAKTNGTPIGEDSYAEPYFREIGHGIHGLLNMDCGRLDCGTLSSAIYDTAKAAGIEGEL